MLGKNKDLANCYAEMKQVNEVLNIIKEEELKKKKDFKKQGEQCTGSGGFYVW